jgi:hypothetical protein
VEVAERLADKEISRKDVPQVLIDREFNPRQDKDRLLTSQATPADRARFATFLALHRDARNAAAYASADAAMCVPGQKGALEFLAAKEACEEVQCRLLHDIFGPLLFRQVPIARPWLSWNDSTVPKLVGAIYKGRCFNDLPILADALEDAGCHNREVLDHCRGVGPHVRGC